MNTAELLTRVRHQPAVPAPNPSRRSSATRKVPIVVLSTDEALAHAIRSAAGEDHEVSAVTSLEEATQLAASGQCGILVTDQALSQAALARVSAKLHLHDPAAITIAVGTQGDDNALIGLLSSAVVERFMMKPVSPALARLVLRSAATEYRSHQSRHRSDALLRKSAVISAPESETQQEPVEPESIIAAVTRIRPAMRTLAQPVEQPAAAIQPEHVHANVAIVSPEQAPTSRDWNPTLWMWVAVAIAAIASLGWWTVYAPDQRVDLSPIIDSNLKAAQAAIAAGNDTEPAESSALYYFTTVLALDSSNADALSGMQGIARRMSERVKDLIIEGRLAEAGIALERLRHVSPDARRLSILEAELRRVQTQQLAVLDAAAPALVHEQSKSESVPSASRKISAEPAPQRLVERVRETELTTSEQKTPISIANVPAESARAPDVEISMPQEPASMALGGSSITPNRDVIQAAAGQGPSVTAEASASSSEANTSDIPVVTQEPQLLHVVQPEYPQEARMRGLEGWVDLTLTVNGSGEVADARVNASSKRMFERPALTAVRKWLYEPITLPPGDAGHAMRLKVQFQMDGR
jgi:protein TonB